MRRFVKGIACPSADVLLFNPRADLPHRLLDRLRQRALGDALGTGDVEFQREAQSPIRAVAQRQEDAPVDVADLAGRNIGDDQAQMMVDGEPRIFTD